MCYIGKINVSAGYNLGGRFKKQSGKNFCYGANEKFHGNFLDLICEKIDLCGFVPVLSLKTKEGYEEINYTDLMALAKNFADYLVGEIKIKKNDRIAILSQSCPEFGIGLFAVIQAGAIIVPLDTKLTIPELTSILTDCQPRIILCSNSYLQNAVRLKEGIKSIENLFILNKKKPEGCEHSSVFEVKSDAKENSNVQKSFDDIALISYTSGTTGNPKGVMISFENIYSQLKDFEKIFKVKGNHTIISILPINHLLELTAGFFEPLYVGAKIIYMENPGPTELSDIMKEMKITNMIVVPAVVKMFKTKIEKEIKKQPKVLQTAFNKAYKIAKFLPLKIRRLMFKQIINEFGGKFEFFICGGAPLDFETGEFFERMGIPVYQGYGLTEAGPTVSTNYPKNNKHTTVGKPLPSVKVKIAQNGEILIKGPNITKGYYNKPEMTAEIFDEWGWLHTGDIGTIDKHGYLKIIGRIKNMIVLSGGKKIFPEEVETVLEKSPLIKEICALSLKIKSGHKKGDEEVGAIVVPSDVLALKTDAEIKKIIETEIKKLSSQNLASYKQPKIILISRDELPKTSTRKIKRDEVLSLCENL